MPPRRPRRPARELALHREPVSPIVAPPANRGRLYYDFEIADEFFAGLKGVKNKLRYIREHLPRAKRIKIGGASCWYESDIVAYIEAQREEQRILEQARETRRVASGE